MSLGDTCGIYPGSKRKFCAFSAMEHKKAEPDNDSSQMRTHDCGQRSKEEYAAD